MFSDAHLYWAPIYAPSARLEHFICFLFCVRRAGSNQAHLPAKFFLTSSGYYFVLTLFHRFGLLIKIVKDITKEKLRGANFFEKG